MNAETNIAAHAVAPQRLVGHFVWAGNLTVNDEEFPGCAVEVPRETLKAASLPMYQQVEIVSEKEMNRLREERDWLAHLVATIRDKGNLRYGKHKGLLAFSDLKDEAERSRPNAERSNRQD